MLVRYFCVLQKVEEVDGERVVDDKVCKVPPERHVLRPLPDHSVLELEDQMYVHCAVN